MDGLFKQQTPYTHYNLTPTVVVYVASVYERLAWTLRTTIGNPQHGVLAVPYHLLRLQGLLAEGTSIAPRSAVRSVTMHKIGGTYDTVSTLS